jgi:hypothetical protein
MFYLWFSHDLNNYVATISENFPNFLKSQIRPLYARMNGFRKGFDNFANVHAVFPRLREDYCSFSAKTIVLAYMSAIRLH